MKKIILLLSIIYLGHVNAQICFGPQTNYSVSPQASVLMSADFNGDAKADLALLNANQNYVSIVLGTGAATFSAETTYTTGTSGGNSYIIGADFNGDNHVDLAITNKGENTVAVLLGTGTGSFDSATIYTVGISPYGLVSADFNSDNIADLATADYGSHGVSILLGTGTGNFNSPVSFYTDLLPYSICSADFNNDGHTDLVTGNYNNTSDISLLLGTGTGSFGTATNFTVGYTPYDVKSADYNKDGNADLVVTLNASTNIIGVLLGTGTGNFGAVTNYTTGPSPHALCNADFDNDGNTDILVAGSTVLLSTGLGDFKPATNFWANISLYSIAAADFNSDGKLDIAGVNGTSLNFSILLSIPPPVVSITSSTVSLCNDSVATLSGHGTSVFYWSTGQTATSITVAPGVTTTYSVIGSTYSSGCTNVASFTQVVTTCSSGINELVDVSKQINIYPNPAQNNFLLETNASNKQLMQLFDVSGKLVLQQIIENKTTVDVTSLQKGVYTISIIGTEGILNKKLILAGN